MPAPLFSTTKYPVLVTGVLSLTANPIREAHLLVVTVKIDVVPVTSENLVVRWHSPGEGAAYSVELMRVDPATEAVQNIVYLPESKLVVAAGDTIQVYYANSDNNQIAAQITMEVGR